MALQQCADQRENNSVTITIPELFEWWTESRFAGVCLAQWTTTSCAGNWSRSWRRSPSRTVAAGTLTSKLKRRCPAGFSGRKYRQSPQRWRTLSVLLILRMMTGCAAVKKAQGPTRKTAPASPTHASVPLKWRLSRGRGPSQKRQPSPETTHKSQVRSTFYRAIPRSILQPKLIPLQWQKLSDLTPFLNSFFVFPDFFAKRRRTTETKSVLKPFHTNSSETALCKTIRWTCC